ncbi:site-specific DNA-methyltransferase [Spirosoma sp.]|uniref:site-specific DNA-methyltransferase n=1 Tax=Spirosoma sp. TaxID=1899569 RepID=UPI00261FDD83|nr:site-specific DNA-methyltransferase [Spirosoma sp.]MCX6214561.1 site-specific DNA-methyltransferase [Spirosoma sp.]
MNGLSLNIAQDKLSQLRQLFPEVFREDQVDFDALKNILGERVAPPTQERYGLTWPGKYDAYREIQKQTTATLTPDRANSINFDTSENIFIEGENLEVLRVLQKSYYGKVKMIYIDPPYNTGNDSFIYPDDYSERREDYRKRTGITDDEGFLNKQDLYRKNSRENGQFHSAWLSMMYPRLYQARNLLHEEGVIFISIDDNEQANLKQLMNEVFGEENFISQLVWQKSKKGDAKLIAKNHEYVLVYGRNVSKIIEKGVWRVKKEGADEVLAQYTKFTDQFSQNHDAISEAMRHWYAKLSKDDPRKAHAHYRNSDANGLYFADNFAGPDDGRTSRPRYDILHPITGKPCKKPSTGWRWDEERTKRALESNPQLIHFGSDETTIPCRKSYLFEIDSEPFASVFYKDGRGGTLAVEQLVGKGIFDFPKDADVLSNFIKLTTEPGDLICDFFAGSATTAQAVLDLNAEGKGNRYFICVQIPEVIEHDHNAYIAGFRTISDISRTRIRNVIDRQNQKQDGQISFSKKTSIGFRAYKLTQTHFKVWRSNLSNPADILEQLDVFQHPLTDDYQTEALFTELLLKAGYSLTIPVERQELAAIPVYRVNNGTTYIALDAINRLLIEAITEQQPQRLITLDKLFNQDNELLSNARLQLRENGIEFTVI